MVLIGLLGKKGSGKDTVADHLVHSNGYTKMAFAEPLKDACKTLFNFSEEQLYGDLKEVIDDNWGVSPRTVLQFVGTDLIRKQMGSIMPQIGEKFWVHGLKVRYMNGLSKDPNFKCIVSDVRFQDEADMVMELGGIVVKLERDAVAADEHISEKGIDTVRHNVLIKNNGTIKKLHDQIDQLLPTFEGLAVAE